MLNTGIARSYDVSPDGKRFIIIKAAAGERRPTPPAIIFVQNWGDEVKQRVGSR
jgi:hypothetical protein